MKNTTRLVLLTFLVFLLSGGMACQSAPKKNPALAAKQIQSIAAEVRVWKVLKSAEGRELPLALKGDGIQIFQPTRTLELPLPDHFLDLIVSRQGRYFAVFSLVSGSKSPRSDKTLTATVYSAEGEELYRVRRLVYYDEPLPARVVSDLGGMLILGQSATGQLDFYSETGSLVKQVLLFRDAQFDLERLLQLAVSADGRSVAVLASKRGASPLDSGAPDPSGEPHLFLFDAGGNELWRMPLMQTTPQNLAISPDGRLVVASSYSSYQKSPIQKNTVIVRADGKKLGETDFLFRHADFAQEAGTVLLADRSEARLIAPDRARVLWKVRYPRKSGIIAAAAVQPDARRAFVLTAANRFEAGRFVFAQPVLHVLDAQGVQRQEIPFPKENFLAPALYVRGNQAILGFSHSLYRIEAQR